MSVPDRVDHLEAEMLFKTVEVAIAVQERVAVPDAKGGGQAIDRSARGNTARTEELIIAGAFDREPEAGSAEKFKGSKLILNLLKMPIAARTPQNFKQDEVRKSDANTHHLLL